VSSSVGNSGTTTQSDRLSVSTAANAAGGADPTGGKFNAGTDVGDVTVGQLVSEVMGDISTLIRKEVELAKAEIRQEASKAGKGAGMLGGAALAGYFTLLFLSLTLTWTLALGLPLPWAALIVTVLWGIGAAVLGISGRNKLRQVRPVPEQTVESVKEDVQWAKGNK